MKYVLLCYDTSETFSIRNDHEKQTAFSDAMDYYVQALKENCVLVGNIDLYSADSAVILQYHDEQRWVLDGPYVDADTQLSSVFIIDVPDLDSALDWAALFPRMPGRAIEIRPALVA